MTSEEMEIIKTKQQKFYESMDGDESIKYENYIQKFAASKSRKKEKFTWLDAERYAARCILLLRQHGILQGAAEISKIKL